MSEHLPDAWDRGLPADDNLVKAYVWGYADLMEATAAALGWPHVRTDRFVAVDGGSAFMFQNCVVPTRPFGVDEADDLLAEVAAFYAPRPGGPYLLWCGFPTPPLRDRGFTLMGHPPLMLRPAGGEAPPVPPGLELVEVTTPERLEEFGTTMVEAFPVPELTGRPYGGFGPGLLEVPGWRMWIGVLDGGAVATAAVHVHGGINDVEWISNRPEARGRGVGAAVTWAATLADPGLPAMLIASDPGQPVYERMGYLRLTRFTLWFRGR
ncbi:MAG: GNAT family N-acetyltransferase [Actinobacteria bacterium]|nr:GNAT family N-acetyltransferase [Actinomycetota bacterium]